MGKGDNLIGLRTTDGTKDLCITHALLIVTALWALFFLTGTFQLPLMHKDEPRYAAVAEEMFDSGDFITPSLEHKPWFEKPPLVYWLMVLSYSVFGVSGWASRLPSLVVTLATLLLLFQFARKAYGTGAGVLAVAICSTFVHFWVMGRAVAPDMSLVLFEMATLYFMFYGIEEQKRPYIYLGHLCMGLAFLAKGPVGVIIPLGILFLYQLLRGTFIPAVKAVGNPLGVMLFSLVGLPWYLIMIKLHGYAFVKEFLLVQNVYRFTGVTHQHTFKAYYYLPIFLGSLYIWTPFFPEFCKRIKEMVRQRSTELFFLIWVAFPLLFFSVSVNKLHNYILIVYPAVALLLARTLIMIKSLGAPVKRSLLVLVVLELSAILLALSRFSNHRQALIAGGFLMLMMSAAVLLAGVTVKRAVSLLMVKGFMLLIVVLAFLRPYGKELEKAYSSVNMERASDNTTVLFYKEPRYDFWFYSDSFFPTIKSRGELDRLIETHKEIVLIIKSEYRQSMHLPDERLLTSFNDLEDQKWEVIEIGGGKI